jgi:hypothetical protein
MADGFYGELPVLHRSNVQLWPKSFTVLILIELLPTSNKSVYGSLVVTSSEPVLNQEALRPQALVVDLTIVIAVFRLYCTNSISNIVGSAPTSITSG